MTFLLENLIKTDTILTTILLQCIDAFQWSQSHKLPEWLRWEVTSAQIGQVEPVARDQVQMAFDSLQRWGLHSLPAKPMPVLAMSQLKPFS